jgi:glycerol-3-phosphate dehydrogenase
MRGRDGHGDRGDTSNKLPGDGMKEYDVIVIGAGVGTSIAFQALSAGMKVALVDKGHPGGTFLNTG